MALSDIDRVVLGHNPFFGVDHLSQAKAAERDVKFQAVDGILEMVRFARDKGVRGMMMSTHPRANLVADALRGDPPLLDSLNIYPLLPYIAKYVRESNEKGLVNVVLDQVKGAGVGQTLSMFTRGGLAVLRKDVQEILRTLIQVELLPFRDLRVKAVFLHDALTDMGLALEMRGIFELYLEEIAKRYEAEPAFATKNLPMLAEKFGAWGFEKPLVLTHFNKVGFNMNPSRQACERCLAESDVQIMTMGSLASGYLKPDEAYHYLFGLPRMDSVVVGVSTRAHAEDTFAAIDRHWSAWPASAA